MNELDPDGFTLGVEEEYQLVSAGTGELRSRARDVLAADWADELRAEVQATMLEVGTHVCSSAEELGAELRRLRLQVASTAASEELRVVAAGMHPFSRWERQRQSSGERYERIRARYGRVVRTEHVFGMHVHVSLPAGCDRVRVQNEVRWFVPHLVALACSSPLYEGADTGYDSYRNVLWRRLPHTGPPPELASEPEYRRLVELLVRTGAAQDEGTLYWSVRPHPTYPTLEFRSTDVCPRIEDAVAIAALVRALVVATVHGGLEAPRTRLPAAADHAVVASNEWLAARYGLRAVLTNPCLPSGEEPARDAILRLVDRLAPAAERLGDAHALHGVAHILERGNGADRIRERAASLGSLAALVDWLAAESVLGTGLDRRREQRPVSR